MKVTGDTPVEELMEAHPQMVRFLVRHGLPPIFSGEPFWGTLAELATERGCEADRLSQLLDELNSLANPESTN